MMQRGCLGRKYLDRRVRYVADVVDISSVKERKFSAVLCDCAMTRKIAHLARRGTAGSPEEPLAPGDMVAVCVTIWRYGGGSRNRPSESGWP